MQDDMIPPHEHVDAQSVDQAIGLLEEHGQEATIIAGNTDEMEWMKNRSRAPRVVVDLKEIDELYGVEERDDGGLRIGAMTKLKDLEDHDLLSDGFEVISDATMGVATPQIRNQATVGGNLTQDSRCWYYREDFDCYRAGGNTCYATTGDAREHAFVDWSRCITANPSDIAPALIALDADVVVEGPRGERRQSASNFFVGPETNITKMTTLSQQEILKEIIVPGTYRDADTYFEKVREREAWDFALVNVAAAVAESGGSVSDARIVVNGVAPVPKRIRESENAIEGSSRSEDDIDSAADAALPNADPFETNEYKVPLTRNLIRRALTEAN